MSQHVTTIHGLLPSLLPKSLGMYGLPTTFATQRHRSQDITRTCQNQIDRFWSVLVALNLQNWELAVYGCIISILLDFSQSTSLKTLHSNQNHCEVFLQLPGTTFGSFTPNFLILSAPVWLPSAPETCKICYKPWQKAAFPLVKSLVYRWSSHLYRYMHD